LDGACDDCGKKDRVHQVEACVDGVGCCGKQVCYPECAFTCDVCQKIDNGKWCVYYGKDIWCTECVVEWTKKHNKESERFFIEVTNKTYWYDNILQLPGLPTFRHTADGILNWNGMSEYGHDKKYYP